MTSGENLTINDSPIINSPLTSSPILSAPVSAPLTSSPSNVRYSSGLYYNGVKYEWGKYTPPPPPEPSELPYHIRWQESGSGFKTGDIDFGGITKKVGIKMGRRYGENIEIRANSQSGTLLKTIPTSSLSQGDEFFVDEAIGYSKINISVRKSTTYRNEIDVYYDK